MPGLIVTARQTYYPIELSNSELLSHFNTIREYNDEITSDCLRQFKKFGPDMKLIDQQPEMIPQLTRQSMITFLYKLSIMSKVTNGIFFHATRLYDRYCSKRIILRDQAKLVIATCLWLAAKTYGGCNHIINNYVIPTGGRFYGPNPRARIPRLSELVHYCNNEERMTNSALPPSSSSNDKFDESMFCQMEIHILDTLNWNVYEPMINDFILNVDENCLIQYELYQTQLQKSGIHHSTSTSTTTLPNSNDNKRNSQNSQTSTDTDATVDDIDDLINEDKELILKIELINLKRFLIDLLCWQYDLLRYEIKDIIHSIFQLINMFSGHDVSPFLSLPASTSNKNMETIQAVFINALINVPQALLLIYKEQKGIIPFVFKVKEYYSNLQMVNAIDMARNKLPHSQYFDSYNNNNNNNTDTSSIESSPSLSITTPSRQQFQINGNTGSVGSNNINNTANKSDNSVFSNHHYPYVNGSASFSAISPITPDMYSFPQNRVNSNDSNKENELVLKNNKIMPLGYHSDSTMLRLTTESQQNSINNHSHNNNTNRI